MNERTVLGLVEPVLVAHGLEVDSLTIIPAGKRKVLRITVDGDGPKGRGPLLDDISAATRDISEALDASPAIGEAPFTLEVSSRGVGTPLTEPKHFRRNIGRLLLVVLTDGHDLRGRLVAADEASLTLQLEPEPGQRLPKDVEPRQRVSLDEVTKATVQVEMNRKHDPELDDLGDETDENDDDENADDENADDENADDELVVEDEEN